MPLPATFCTCYTSQAKGRSGSSPSGRLKVQSKLSIQVLTFIASALFLLMPFAVMSGSVGMELLLLLGIQVLLAVIVAAHLGDLLNPIVFTLASWTYLYAFQPLIYVYAGDIVPNALTPAEAILVSRFSTIAAVL